MTEETRQDTRTNQVRTEPIEAEQRDETDASQLILDSVGTDLIPKPVEYAVLQPRRMEEAPLPLLMLLHGSGHSRSLLKWLRPRIEALWVAGELPPFAIATPSGRMAYLDAKDGSERWETFLTGPFLDHLAASYGLSVDRASTAVAGWSMGGVGALRTAFRHCDRFAAVAAMAPGMEPAYEASEVRPRNTFYKGSGVHRETGKPVDEAFWEANNPVALARDRAEAIRQAGLAVYLEAGDEDMLNLHEGVEFLHRVLWKHDIPHEYRLLRGVNHFGPTLPSRYADVLRFIGRVFAPPPADTQSERAWENEFREQYRASLGEERGPAGDIAPEMRDFAV